MVPKIPFFLAAVLILTSCGSVKSPAEACLQAFTAEAKARQWEGVKLVKVGSSIKDLRLVPERTAKYETVHSAFEFLQKNCPGTSFGFVGNEAASK
jgi:hypothetical protein